MLASQAGNANRIAKRGSLVRLKQNRNIDIMSIIHTNRHGKRYFLHTGPKKGGTQYFFSANPDAPLAGEIPDGFEVYETVGGQVYLRRKRPRLVLEEEEAHVKQALAGRRGPPHYEVEVRGDVLTVHESTTDLSGIAAFDPRLTSGRLEELSRQFATFMPVMRFVLVDKARRHFAPERYCFRDSVDDWIPIGPQGTIPSLAHKYLKHLGKDSLYELY